MIGWQKYSGKQQQNNNGGVQAEINKN